MSDYQQLNGADWLDALAQEAITQGLSVNASEYSRRANEWRNDLSTLENAQSLVDSMSSGSANIKRNAAHAYDLLSRVLPAEDDVEAYEQVRQTLSALGDVPLGPTAWGDRTDLFGRNPRETPMPGDRYYLPVEVFAATYCGERLTVTYAPMLQNEVGELEPRIDHRFALLSCPNWQRGAIGVVSSPRAALKSIAPAEAAAA